MKALSTPLVICSAMLLLSTACSENTGKKLAASGLATVGGSAIEAEALRQGLEERPLGKKSGSVAAAVRNRLDELVLEEVLYQEAMAQEIDQDPLVRKAVRQLLIGKLFETRVEKPAWDDPVSPDRIRAFYEAHQHEFERREQVRLADIFIAVPEEAGEHERNRLLQEAERILARAMEVRDERSGFSRLIARHSDTPTHYGIGDTGFFDAQGGPVGIDQNLARAAFQIEKNGGIAGQVVEASDGFHIIMRIAKRSAVRTPLSKVSKSLAQRIRRERLETERESYFTYLRERSKIRINEPALSAIVQDVEKMRTALSQMKKNRKARPAQGNAPPTPEVR